MRKNKRHETVDVSDDTEDNDTFIEKQPEKDEALIPEDALDNEAKRKIILQIISSLPDNQKECVMLFYYSEMSVKDIAEHLGVSEGTVKSRLNYARQKIKEGILETEEKQDIRLHGFIPLGLFLLKDFEAITAALPIPALAGGATGAAATAGVGADGSTAAASGTAAGSSASAGAVGGGSAAASSAAGVAKAGLFAAAKTKVIAGVVAGLLAVGGIGAAVAMPDKGEVPQSGGQAIHQNDEGSGQVEGTPVQFADANMEYNMRLILGKKKNEPVTKEELFEIQNVAFVDGGMNVFDGNYDDKWADGTSVSFLEGDSFTITALPPAYPGTKPVSDYADLAYFYSESGEDEEGIWTGPLMVYVNSSSDVNLNQILSLGLPEVYVCALGEGMQYWNSPAFGESGSDPIMWR